MWPRTYHPIHPCGGPDRAVTVQAYCHQPDNTSELAAWTSGTICTRPGGPVVVLPGDRPPAQRRVHLGDMAVRLPDGSLLAEAGATFVLRYTATIP